MQILRTNKRGKFVSIKLKKFCNKRKIKIKYATPYIYKENGIAKQDQRIIVIIKDFLLIDNELLLEF